MRYRKNRRRGSRNAKTGRAKRRNEKTKVSNRLNLQIFLHYVYNSLQCIACMCDTDPEKAKKAIIAFTDFLRIGAESLTESELIPFAKELGHVEAFVELERLIGEREFEIEYDLEKTDFMIPSLVLQPVVENAVFHAGCGKSGIPQITVSTAEQDGDIYIEVTDRLKQNDDVGVSSEKKSPGPVSTGTKKSKSIALENVKARLAAQSGGTLAIQSNEDGTTVTIKMTNKISQPKSPKPSF